MFGTVVSSVGSRALMSGFEAEPCRDGDSEIFATSLRICAGFGLAPMHQWPQSLQRVCTRSPSSRYRWSQIPAAISKVLDRVLLCGTSTSNPYIIVGCLFAMFAKHDAAHNRFLSSEERDDIDCAALTCHISLNLYGYPGQQAWQAELRARSSDDWCESMARLRD